MPNWKKLILSGSNASLNSLIVTSGVTGSLFGTASYANNGGVTQIVAGTNVSLTPSTGVGAVTINASVTYGAGTNTTASFANTASWVFNHNLSTQFPVIQAYDLNYNQIVPQSITLVNANTATLTFPGNESGYAVASVGGVGVSAATASYVLQAVSASYATTASYSLTAVTASYILRAVSSSFATTASYILNAVSASYSISASYYGGSVTTASFASTASYVNSLIQNIAATGSVLLSGSISITSGSITMPDRPAFRVTGAGGGKVAVTTLSGSYLNVDYQQGSGWNNTSGTFTAPLAGLYQVNLVTRTNSNSLGTISQLIVFKNNTGGTTGTPQIMIEYGTSTSMNHTGGSTISKLAVGDTLKMVVAVGEISFDQNDNFSVAYIG